MVNDMLKALAGMVASSQKLQTSASNLVSLGRNNFKVGDNHEFRPDLNCIEASKVDISNEMVAQINAQAEFRANAKVIVVADETIGTILDIKS